MRRQLWSMTGVHSPGRSPSAGPRSHPLTHPHCRGGEPWEHTRTCDAALASVAVILPMTSVNQDSNSCFKETGGGEYGRGCSNINPTQLSVLLTFRQGVTSNLKSCYGSGHELCKFFNDHWKPLLKFGDLKRRGRFLQACQAGPEHPKQWAIFPWGAWIGALP